MNLEDWRARARSFLAAGTAPALVFFDGPSLLATETSVGPPSARVPRAFMSLAEEVACHRDSARWHLLYRLLWRLTHGEPELLRISTDDDVHQARAMVKDVSRDAHRMKAFVRFRRCESVKGERYIAWHQPDHFVLERVAPFFAHRFSSMRWSILTPDASAHWADGALTFGAGAPRADSPAEDDLEALWRDYYASTFNPARVNVKTMKQHMPERYWSTLPELKDLDQLLDGAQRRVASMLSHTTPRIRSAADHLPQDGTSLEHAAQRCRGCPLHANATQAVFGEGPTTARMVLVGEQPGDQEDLAGRPFVGPAGQLLDEALQEAGIDRATVYLTNAVKHFKFTEQGKRRIHERPNVREVKACLPWLEAELARVQPTVLVCLGSTAARAILGAHVEVTKLRGQWVPTPRAANCLVTFHPAAILRLPPNESAQARRQLVDDLRLAALTAERQ